MYPTPVSTHYVMHPAALRRASFLLDEARQGEDAIRDHAVTFAMRAITNYAQFGEDLQSGRIKERIQFVSPQVAEMMREGVAFKALCSCTYNEHPMPLQSTWEWMLDNANSLTPEDVVRHIGEYPMVLVSKEENSKLRKLKDGQTPEGRYLAAGLIVLDRPFP